MEDIFRYVDLTQRNTRGIIPPTKARMHYVKRHGNAENRSSSITLSRNLSAPLIERGFLQVRLRENTLTGELYLVFCAEETPGSIKVNVNSKSEPEKANVVVCSRVLVEYIMKRLDISPDTEHTEIELGGNISRVGNVVVHKISK